MLKKCAPFISEHISQFLNSFMRLVIFPQKLKVGKVSPIFIKGDVALLDNNRPISVLPIFGKIFEKIIYNRLYSFLTSEGMMYKKHFGFRKHHSTAHAINYSIIQIINELQQKKTMLLVYLLILAKLSIPLITTNYLLNLSTMALEGSCHKLLTNYLLKREQYINFKGTDSDVQEVEFGVPQGSVLGPLLFLIYINDLVNSSTRGDFVLFADDTNIFFPSKTKIEAYENAQIVLNGIHEYMFSNQLHINLTKSVYMHLRPYFNQNVDRQTCARCRIEKNPAINCLLITC